MTEYGFRTAGFRNELLAVAIESIAQAGYSCVELCLEYHGLLDMPPAIVSQMLREIGDSGLRVCSFSYHGDGEPPVERWRNIGRALDLAIACEVPVLILNGDRVTGPTPRLADRARPLVDAAATSGVLLAVEPEPGLSVPDTAAMLGVLSELPAPPLAVNLDVGHAFLTDDLSETFRALGSHIVHLHVEGMRTGVHKHLLPGDGNIDFRLVGALADEIGYTGPWVIDLFHADASPFDYCPEALRRLRLLLPDDA